MTVPLLLPEVITSKMQMLLDHSYLKSMEAEAKRLKTTQTETAARSCAHRRRVKAILDDPARARELVGMVLRNDLDTELVDMVSQFDYFTF